MSYGNIPLDLSLREQLNSENAKQNRKYERQY